MVENQPEFVFLADEDCQVISLPPLTNAERTARAGMNDDHLHQIIQFCKDNFTSTFPFALILILKGFYEHSAGQFTLTLTLIHFPDCFSLFIS